MAEADCNKCAAPGMCCKAFTLGLPVPLGSLPADVLTIMNVASAQPLPFLPLRRDGIGINENEGTEQWLFHCPKLGDNGRCTIYETRPDTCRVFKAGEDPLCVHWYGATGVSFVAQTDGTLPEREREEAKSVEKMER